MAHKTSAYARGRAQEYNVVNHINKRYGKDMKAERVLLSGQRGEGDVILTKPLSKDDGITLAIEVKARKSVPKTVYEWLGKHDLLVMKKIGQKWKWLIVMDLDLFLSLLAQLSRNPDTSDKSPNDGRAGDGD